MPNGQEKPDRKDARLTLETLGVARLCALGNDGCASPVLEIGKPLALIVYLSCSPGRQAQRDHVIDLLWADLEPDAARHALRQTLWHIKRRVSESLITALGVSLELTAQMFTDRDQFLDAAGQRNAERVVELYAGDFLPGFAAPGGAEFENWADTERRHLRSIFQRSADALVRHWLTLGRFKDAQALARRVRNLDTMNEAGWRLLLESLIAGSDHVRASTEADALEQLLSREEQEPEQATRALLRVARQPTAPSTASTSDRLVAELIGREREFSSTIAAWEVARSGSFRHVHIVSPAGLGKTRLLADVHARLRAMRARVAHVRANVGSRDIPYSVASELASALAALPGAPGIAPDSASALVSLNPTLSSIFNTRADSSVGDEALRRRALALRDLVSATSEQHALAILVDDMHWVDSASRALLLHLLATVERQRVLIVTASRPVAEGMIENVATLRLTLAPLRDVEVSALVSSLSSLPNTHWAAWLPSALHDATGGSPLLILETIHLLIDRGLLERHGREWRARDEHQLRGALRSRGALADRLATLSDAERAQLLLLATSGRPSELDVVSQSSGRTRNECLVTLTSLEARGFVARTGESWQVAHDEIAQAMLDSVTAADREAVERALGAVLLRYAEADPASIRRAAIHLTRGEDDATLAAAFVRFARLLREGGDRRAFRAIAEDFLASDKTAARVQRLTRQLPFHMRAGFDTRQRRVAATVGLVAFPILLWAMVLAFRGSDAGPPDAELVIFRKSGDGVASGYSIPVRARDWSRTEPLRVGRNARPVARVSTYKVGVPIAAQPNTNGWAVSLPVSDSGQSIDVFLVSTNGESRRLTRTPGEDDVGSWSPDGKSVAISTGRWNPLSRFDIATLDVGTGDMRQLTSGDMSDIEPHWSPDGTRIGFLRKIWAEGGDSACVIDADGQHLRCLSVGEAHISGLPGWYDGGHVFLTIGEPGNWTLVLLDVASGATREFEQGVKQTPIVSEDGRWVACMCRRVGHPDGVWLVYPSTSPSEERELPFDSETEAALAWIAWRVPKRRFLDSLDLSTNPPNLQLDVPHALLAAGTDSHGESMETRAATWSVNDTLFATIDRETGILVPRKVGPVVVTVSAGGWRRKSRSFTVVSRAPASLVLHEDWRGSLDKQWYSFGDPSPRIIIRDSIAAMLNAGDGSFVSGVHSRVHFAAADGVSVDADVSATITGRQWQTLTVALHSAVDTGRITTATRAQGDVTLWSNTPSSLCGFGYPGGEKDPNSVNLVLGYSADQWVMAQAPEGIRTGRWFRVRVQLFPDGRCGVAVNGVPFFVSAGRAGLGDSVVVLLHGNSFQTQMLTGPVTVRSGVPQDIDWAAYQRTRSREDSSSRDGFARQVLPGRLR